MGDYLQLIFEDNLRTWSWQCYVWPTVILGDVLRHLGDAGYRDALCALIGQDVHWTKDSPDTSFLHSDQP